MRHLLTNLLPLLLVGACADHPPAQQTVEYFPLPNGLKFPFSEAVRVGSMLYLSGAMGTDSTGKLVPGGVEAETRQALGNIKATLERRGLTLDHVVKCTVMMADMAEWPKMNDIYRTFFTAHLPARSAFGASGLALGGRVEIECLARYDR